MPNADGDTPITRLCDLPWQKFVVDTSVDPPTAAPCRNYNYDWNARDLVGNAESLRGLRQDLLSGSLKAPCRACPDKKEVPTSELHDLIANKKLRDTNRLMDAVQEVIQSPPPTPPSELMYRVSHTRNPEEFLISGLITFFDLMPLIEQYDKSEQRRVLDWGCGSGRLSTHIARLHPEIELNGCDIDPEAVRWSQENISGGRFSVSYPLPPTGFERGKFTSIIAYSIVTHLSRKHQLAWIDELYDLLDDGGVLVITTMGATAARANGVEDALKNRGILDDRLDTTFDDVTPLGYYRSTFQSRAFTEKFWGRRFEVLEYSDAAIFNFQDLVVLRKKPKTSRRSRLSLKRLWT